ncbi:acetyltransferase [Candidatus Uhrbacteria bacterium]|nr:acetyltransferase [Candidatus Uhrbacteria bacterium]
MQKIVVIGGGGHAKVVTSILKKLNTFEILGYTDRENQGPLLYLPYIGTDDVLHDIKARHGECAAVLGLGYLGKDDLRERLVEKLRGLGFTMPAIVSPTAVVNEDVQIGEGTVVMDGVVINSGTRIGRYAIINTRASIDHDCVIGDFTHIAPGVTFSGGVKVGSHSLIGVGATVVQYKTIGDHCTVGAGAAVTKDCLEPGTYVGIPARKILQMRP